MNRPSATDTELTSWKEIAAYLNVSVRTAQVWEKERGLPIRRLPGGPRGRVSIRTSDLEDWKALGELSELKAPQVTGQQTTGTGLRHFLAKRVLPVTVVMLAILGGAWALRAYLQRSGPPTSWRVEENTLFVTNERGQELWRHRFERTLATVMYDGPGAILAAYQADIDGDGRVETLFPFFPKEIGQGYLICLSDQGVEKWRFTPGRALRSRSGEEFTGTYRVYSYIVAPMGRDHELSIVVASTNHPEFPAQIALLAKNGVMLREYWHSGHIGQNRESLRVADFDKDGANEIYASGVSNGYGQATLIILDPETMDGAATEVKTKFQLDGFKPGTEKARILFPRTCINRAVWDYNIARDIHITPDLLTVHVVEKEVDAASPPALVLYKFTPPLALKSVSFASGFRTLHEILRTELKLDHAFSEDEEAAALRNIRYLIPSP